MVQALSSNLQLRDFGQLDPTKPFISLVPSNNNTWNTQRIYQAREIKKQWDYFKQMLERSNTWSAKHFIFSVLFKNHALQLNKNNKPNTTSRAHQAPNSKWGSNPIISSKKRQIPWWWSFYKINHQDIKSKARKHSTCSQLLSQHDT